MTEAKIEKAHVEKICLDNECQENIVQLPEACKTVMTDFVYCPYCSEELNLQCSACHESLLSKDFKFCPWCGAEFGK